MNTKKLIALAALAAGLASSAFAQATISVSNSDLVLGFRKASTLNDVMVDIGQASIYETASSAFTVGQYSSADVTSTFGSFTGVKWGVFGSDVNAATAWATKGTGTLNNLNGDTSASDNIGIMYSSLNGVTSTANSNFSALVSSGVGSNGYTDSITQGGQTASGPYFNYFATSVEATGAGTQLNLWELTQDSGVGKLLGFFALSSGGALTFNPAASAIPEPSTYAGLLGVVTLGIVAIRRRRQAALSV